MVHVEWSIVALAAGAALLLYGIGMHLTPGKTGHRLLSMLVSGLLLLSAWQLCFSGTNASVGINVFSCLLTGTTGLPGVLVLAGLHLLV